MRRVVITGMGMVTPLGQGVDHNWAEITNGKSGIRKIEHFKCDDISSQIAGIIPTTDSETPKTGEFNANLFVEPKEQRKIDIFITYALAAATEAVADSGWDADTEEKQDRTADIAQ